MERGIVNGNGLYVQPLDVRYVRISNIVVYVHKIGRTIDRITRKHLVELRLNGREVEIKDAFSVIPALGIWFWLNGTVTVGAIAVAIGLSMRNNDICRAPAV